MDVAASVGGAAAATLAGIIGALVHRNRRRNYDCISDCEPRRSIDCSGWNSLREGQLVALWCDGRQVGQISTSVNGALSHHHHAVL